MPLLLMRDRAWLHRVGVLVVLILAIYLRMGQPGIVEYKRDEANLSQLALDVANGRHFPLLGIGSSVGIPNAPVNVYLLAIPYLLDSSPQIATQFIGLLNVFAIFLTYLLAKRYIGGWWALLIIVIFVVNPWAVNFSRKIWAQNMLPLFVVIAIGTGILAFIEGKRWAQVFHLPVLMLTGQIHYGAFVIIPVTLYLLWYGRRYLTSWFWLSIGLSIILVLPYGIGMIQAGYANIATLRGALAGGEGEQGLVFSWQALRSAGLLLAGTEIHALAGPQEFQNYLNQAPDAYPLFNLLAWMVGVATLWMIIRIVRYRDERTPVDIVLIIWLIFPILVFSLTWTPFFIHYLIPIFPAAYLILGLALYDFWKCLGKRSKFIQRGVFATGGVGLGVILILQMVLWLNLLDFVDNRHTPDGFGTPLHYLLDVRDEILDEQPQQVIANVGGQALIFDEGPTIWNTLLYDVPDVRFEDAATQVYPEETAIYLVSSCDESGEVFPLREGEGCLNVGHRGLESSQNEFLDYTLLQDDSGLLNNSVQIVGYLWDQSPDMCLSLLWEIQADFAQMPDRAYMFAVKFLDEDGNEVAQADGLSWSANYWRASDLIVREFCLLQQTEGITSVNIGMYQFDGQNFYNAEFVNKSGETIGQTIQLDLNR